MPIFLRAAVVAVCVFALAACGAPDGGTDVSITGSGDPSVAATVNGTEISVEQVKERFDTAKTQPQVAQQLESDTDGAYESNIQAQILTQLVVSELLEQWATDLDIEATEEEIAAEREALIEQIGGQEAFDTAVKESGLSAEDVESQIRQQVLQKEISAKVGEDSEVTDADIEAFYEQNRDSRFGEKATARHILVKDKAKADDLMAQLRNGADFAKLAEKESTDPGSAAQGGELPEFGRGQMVPPFEEAVFSAKVGELVGPVKTDFGFHIIEVLDLKPGQELDEVRDEIRTELSQSQGGEALQAELQKRTKEAEVTVNPRFGTWNPETGQVEPTKPLGGASETATPGATEPGGVPTESATP